MQKYPAKSDQLKIFKKCVWKYDLLSWCAVVLKYDYTKVSKYLQCNCNILYIIVFVTSTFVAVLVSTYIYKMKT